MNFEPFAMDAYDDVFEFWSRIPGIGLSSVDDRLHIGSYLERNPGMSWLMRDCGKIVGAALCGHDGRRGYIHHLAVDPRHRGQGFGTALLQHCIDTLQKEGIQKSHVFVFNKNELGRGFWAAKGWQLRRDISIYSKNIL